MAEFHILILITQKSLIPVWMLRKGLLHTLHTLKRAASQAEGDDLISLPDPDHTKIIDSCVDDGPREQVFPLRTG
jgi:hypothetical protein